MAEKLIKFIKFWFPVCVYSGIIFWLSEIPGDVNRIIIPYLDKFVHIVEYGPYGYLLARAFHCLLNEVLGQKLILLVIISTFVYGLSDEFHQSFVVGRESSLMDVAADTIGGTLGLVLFWVLAKKRKLG